MGLFDSLYPTKKSKKNANKPFANMLCTKAKDDNLNLQENRNLLVQAGIKNLTKLNDKRKKKFLPDSIYLWALLDIQKYIDACYDLTLNPYIEKNPELKNDPLFYTEQSEKYMNILDIKFFKKFKIEKVQFKNVFLVTFEIYDKKIDFFRPYVELYIKTEDGTFHKFGYGYDKNDDSIIELYIDNLNYAIFLNPKGYISLPFKGKKISLHVTDIISSTQIDALLEGVYIEDLEV